jgi:hypothetical protein
LCVWLLQNNHRIGIAQLQQCRMLWVVEQKQKLPRGKGNMKTYDIHYYKTQNLRPDERNAMRKNQTGIWLMGPRVEAENPHAACARARKEQGWPMGQKLRARRAA